MFTILTHAQVQDYAKWRPVFDEFKSLRDAHSLESERVFRNAANPNNVFIEMKFRDEAGAHAYMALPELRAQMQKAGVIPPPETYFLEDAPQVAALDASTQIVKQVVGAIEAQNWSGVRALLTDDFKFSGAVPEPISAEQWIGVHRALAAAMPDLRLNYVPSKSNGSHTHGTVKITGTHKGEFNLPVPGVPRVAATNHAIANPTESIEVTVKGGKVSEWQVEPLSNGGLSGILSQMGVALPHA